MNSLIRVLLYIATDWWRFPELICGINENGIHQKQDDFVKNLECFIFTRLFYDFCLDWNGFGFNVVFCPQLILLKGTHKVYSAVD